ncbi:cilia- and flagella-associated protein 95 isoform X2 [Monodelphis domestica]|uniref:cilia- and flagella-associated protein 95 isoform X2 n=1 Tax=Monodelphis domestica TaxID=13616 RepID=UPI0004434059|nr:cilia- and flagella-associated protein 95 isoform X2 [Monodelphis domestica]
MLGSPASYGYLELGPTDVLERKGSLTLRSHHKNYSKPVLVYGWHVDREGYPKDYDINQIPFGSKNLCNSSYLRYGNEDTMPPVSETHAEMVKTIFCEDFGERKSLPLLNKNTIDLGIIEREWMTSYKEDFVPPYDYMKVIQPLQDMYSVVHRRCRSQFADVEGYKRPGIHSWQDESGIYGNSDLRHTLFPAVSPILPFLK